MNLHARPPFDMVNDFAAITQTTSQPYVLVVHPGLAANNIKELIALAKAKPGGLQYASSGSGSIFRRKTPGGLDLLRDPPSLYGLRM